MFLGLKLFFTKDNGLLVPNGCLSNTSERRNDHSYLRAAWEKGLDSSWSSIKAWNPYWILLNPPRLPFQCYFFQKVLLYSISTNQRVSFSYSFGGSFEFLYLYRNFIPFSVSVVSYYSSPSFLRLFNKLLLDRVFSLSSQCQRI